MRLTTLRFDSGWPLAQILRKDPKRTDLMTRTQRSIAPKLYSALAVVVAVLAFSPRVGASSITYDFDHTFSGVSPAGPTPWLTAVFSDSGANSVQLTLAAPGLTGSEFVKQWYFNLNPALNASQLNFTPAGSSLAV